MRLSGTSARCLQLIRVAPDKRSISYRDLLFDFGGRRRGWPYCAGEARVMGSRLGADLPAVSTVGKCQQQSEHHQANGQPSPFADPNGRIGFGVQIEPSRRFNRPYILRIAIGTILWVVAHG
jgi:hypothetical protein